MHVDSDAENSQSQASEPAATASAPRFRWRAIVRVGQRFDAARGHQSLAWHLADCADPAQLEAHCQLGRHLIATDGNPDGHCLVDGVCPRCPAIATTDDS
ncbi:MAG: hypothetical protein JO023_28465 [Chloroflexi bacterium]|nr:hypothetical protein [Chloroflexota bacterium]